MAPVDIAGRGSGDRPGHRPPPTADHRRARPRGPLRTAALGTDGKRATTTDGRIYLLATVSDGNPTGRCLARPGGTPAGASASASGTARASRPVSGGLRPSRLGRDRLTGPDFYGVPACGFVTAAGRQS
ncbi:hypothetical protein KPATCC21470_7391 [Kitasatospora purpeofusca]